MEYIDNIPVFHFKKGLTESKIYRWKCLQCYSEGSCALEIIKCICGKILQYMMMKKKNVGIVLQGIKMNLIDLFCGGLFLALIIAYVNYYRSLD